MPEGVEVRLFTEGIKIIENNVIKNIEQYYFKKMFSNFNPLELIGYKINKVFNKAKHIFWEIEKDNIKKYIEIQLGMSGGFRLDHYKHDMIKIEFDKFSLYYNDIRRFGRWQLHDEDSFKIKYKLIGDDILDMTDEQIENLSKNISKKYLNKPIKAVLMDQNFIGGIGNIYVTESLFRSKVLPYKQTKEISPELIFDILINARKVMQLSYRLQGMSVHSFENMDGEKGEGKNLLQLYGHTICSICGKKLIKVDIGGRTSIFCDNCQK